MENITPNKELFEKVVSEHMGKKEKDELEKAVKALIRMLIG
jgi:hypothetical protein